VLISQARDILESLRRLSVWESTFVPATAQRHFRICMTDASHITLLPELLAHVRAVAPEVRLEAAGIDSNTAHALESGEADLALGYIPSLESGIYQQTLFPQNWVCLANASHPRIGKTLTLQMFKEEAHIIVAAGTGYQLLEAALASRRIKRKVVLELPGFLGLVRIVATTDLIVHAAAAHRGDACEDGRPACLRVPHPGSDVHGQAALARALSPGSGEPLAPRRDRHAVPPAHGARRQLRRSQVLAQATRLAAAARAGGLIIAWLNGQHCVHCIDNIGLHDYRHVHGHVQLPRERLRSPAFAHFKIPWRKSCITQFGNWSLASRSPQPRFSWRHRRCPLQVWSSCPVPARRPEPTSTTA
jgi:DNA-binding transcriptional LysR family regulator